MLIKTSIAAAFLLSAAAPTLAGQGGQTVSESVRIADLNLATPEGARTLHNRIERAIRRLCYDPYEYSTTAGLMGLGSASECRREARAAIAARLSAVLAIRRINSRP